MEIKLIQSLITPLSPRDNFNFLAREIGKIEANGTVIICPALALTGKIANKTADILAEAKAYGTRLAGLSTVSPIIFGNYNLLGAEEIFVAQNGVITEHFSPITATRVDILKHSIGFIGENGEIPTSVENYVKLSQKYFTHDLYATQVVKLQELSTEVGKDIYYLSGYGINNNGGTNWVLAGGSFIAKFGEGLVSLPFCETGILSATTTSKVDICDKMSGIYAILVFAIRELSKLFGIKKAVIGISGGIDSAVISSLAVAAFGKENVLGVNMPSRFNSEATKTLAATLAENLAVSYITIPVSESMSLTIRDLEKAQIDAPVWDLDISTLVLENVQARDRGSRILSALAASVGGGILCTGNKTECAIGYATFYGDMVGYLAPIADLWKGEVYDLARYINRNGEIIPQGIIDIKPSAELSENQDITKDLGDPLFYPYHDLLLKMFVEENKTITDIAKMYIDGKMVDLGAPELYFPEVFDNDEDFFVDLERWWNAYKGIGVAKRIQSTAIVATGKKPWGSAVEQQVGVFISEEYIALKSDFLK